MAVGTYILNGFGIAVLKPKLYPKQTKAEDKSIGFSQLGTPVFDSFRVLPGAYLDNDGIEISYEGFEAQTALFEVSMTKNIVTTAINGRNGTVKEYVSDGDYVINIKGAIVDKDGLYPELEMQKLADICRVPEQINIVSGFLNNFFITHAVITDYNFPQSEGMRNVQLFSINMISDKPIELQDAENV